MTTRINPRLRTRLGVTLTLILLLFSGPQSAQADEDATRALQDQVEILTQMVRSLQKQVKALQQKQSSPQLAVSPPGKKTDQGHPMPATIPEPNSSTSIPVEPSRTISERQATTPADIRKNWHALKTGLNNHAVKVLLGPPSRSFKLNNGKPLWYYDYEGIGVGSVMFSNDGQVTGWQAPPSNWLW